jgi:hypothetical protein
MLARQVTADPARERHGVEVAQDRGAPALW